MSTSNKLTYLNVTKQKLKQAINNIGGEVTDETTFRNYVAELENAYDKLPKTEFEEGESVTLENTLKGKLDFQDGKVGFGQASQESTSGTNLANTTGYMAPTTNHGVTYSLKDNEISLNGTCDTAFYINFPGKFEMKSGDYTFAIADVSGTYTGTCGKYPAVNGSNVFDGNHLSNVANRSIDTDYTNVYIRLFVAQGCTFTNFKCKFNLVKGTYTAQTIPTWEEYSNGYASPSPNYAQEVECVAGINICDKDNEIRIGGTTSPLDTTRLSIGLAKKLKANTTYTIVTNLNLSSFHYAFVLGKTPSPWMIANQLFDSGWISNTNHYSVTTTQECYMNIPIRNSSNSEIEISDVDDYWFMVYEGEYDSSIPYTPYNTIEEVVSGKNLFIPELTTEGVEIGQVRCSITINNGEYTITPSGADFYYGGTRSTGSAWTGGFGTLYDISKYSTLVLKLTNTNLNKNYVNFYDSNKISLGYSQIDNTTGLITRPENAKYCSFRIGKQTYTEGDVFKTYIQLESGSVASTYEPYITPTSYQLSLGEYKFYGIGTYRDYILRTTGKNLFNSEIEQGGYYASGSPSESNNLVRTKDLMQIYDVNSNYVFSNVNNLIIDRVLFFDSSQSVISRSDSLESAIIQSSIIPSNTKYIKLTIRKNNFGTLTPSELINPMLEEGSTASDYQPFGTGNWYKFEKIGYYKITGQETINRDTPNNRFELDNLVDILHLQARQQVYCNRFQYVSSGSADYGMFAYWNGAITQVFIYDKDYTDPDDLKNYFANNETYFCYIRNTPVLTPITGTLAEQLEEWWNGQSLDGTTIIEGDGDLPLIIKVRGLKGE